jgi:phosphopantetheine--protein transferase-like protein
MTEVIGCGIDIEELNRFTKHFSDSVKTPPFASMVFSENEIEKNLNNRPELTFPLGFSCKEAFFKAFGVSWTNSKISWKDIELLFLNNENINDYSIRLNGFAKELYEENECTEIISSFDFTNIFVTFNVILLSNKN